ncbi:hypothetical protein [Nisaea sediminum]|uniref:hypothetical protein n=1 Tax=Nisaea sediminum TaxID=2775867 RepID=UPI001866D979|nr:hypothetical protein [Nisaea sediminum]
MPDDQGFLTDDEIASLPEMYKAFHALGRKLQSLQIALEKASTQTERQDILLRMEQIDIRQRQISEGEAFTPPTDQHVKDIREAVRNLVQLNAQNATAQVILSTSIEIAEMTVGNGPLAAA